MWWREKLGCKATRQKAGLANHVNAMTKEAIQPLLCVSNPKALDTVYRNHASTTSSENRIHNETSVSMHPSRNGNVLAPFTDLEK
jgi:hypothetical protein